MQGELKKDVTRGSSESVVRKGTKVTILSWMKQVDDGHCLVKVGKYGRPFDTLQENVTLIVG